MKNNEEITRLKNLDLTKLETELSSMQKKACELILKIKAGKEDNFSEVKKAKKNIARVLTVINEKVQNGQE